MLIPHQSFEASATYEEALDRAATEWGIEREYTDTWGHRHITTPEIQRAILKARGVPVQTKEDLDRAIEERLWREWSTLLPPVLVLSAQTLPREFPLHVPAAIADGSAIVEVCWEEGSTHEQKLALADLRTSGQAKLRDEIFVRKQTVLPETLPLGYHDVHVIVSATGRKTQQASMRLIVCPERVYQPPVAMDGYRGAGLAISLYGLRSERNWGCGDFTDLECLTHWLSEDVGASFIGLNPLHSLANRYPYNISPYLPISIFYQNLIYIDVERIQDFHQSKRAKAMRSSADVIREIKALRASPHVEYARVHVLKLRALKLAFLTFLRKSRDDAGRKDEFESFIEREGDLLHRFATFCALDECIHAAHPEVWIWTDWPEQYQNPESDATRAFASKHWRRVTFYKYVQWQLDNQLGDAQRHALDKGMSIGLYQDLALATDRYGADFWAYRPVFVSGCRVGAPPDGFSPKGQDWSFPPPNFERDREDGYRLFIQSIRNNARHAGALRFDHVMRFFRLYWISEGMEPTDGAYVRENYRDLLNILALESVRNKVVLIGEDLGTVTPKIRDALNHFGILGYKVPYFEKNRHEQIRPPHEYAEHALVSSSTHDLPTLAGFWYARDIEAKREAGLLTDESTYARMLAERRGEKKQFLDLFHQSRLVPDWFPGWAEDVREFTGELHNAFVGFLAIAPSRLMVLNQEDLFKEIEQQNLPATTSEYPNWQHKMKFTIEELRTSQQARDFAAMFRDWLERTGRSRQSREQLQAG